MTLYELTDEMMTLLSWLEEADDESSIPDQQAIEDTLAMVAEDFCAKADGYGKVLKQLQADAEAVKAEKMRLAARQSSLEKSADRLKEAMRDALVKLGQKSLKTDLFTFSTRAGQELVIDAESVYELPMEMVRIVDPVPDKMAIKKYIKEHAGEEITWAHMEPTVSLIVK